jgi:hypothetical protein
MNYSKPIKSAIFLMGILLSISFNALAQLFPLPKSLDNVPVYYHKTQQINNWSCCYNVLYNACKLEDSYGRANKHANFSQFSNTCLPQLAKHGIHNTRAGLAASIGESLGHNLRLQNICTLQAHSNKITPFIRSIHYNPKHQTAQQAYAQKGNELIADLKHKIDSAPTGQPYFIHFICSITSSNGVPHAALASVVKHANGQKEIHITDNMNDPIREKSQMNRIIDYICHEFDIKNGHKKSQPASHTKSKLKNKPVQKQKKRLSNRNKAKLLKLRLAKAQVQKARRLKKNKHLDARRKLAAADYKNKKRK